MPGHVPAERWYQARLAQWLEPTLVVVVLALLTLMLFEFSESDGFPDTLTVPVSWNISGPG